MSEWTDIGEQLRKARESKGLDLRDVAHTTRIPLSTLTALEQSDYSIFPSPSYARSFLSQYSEFLSVDAHEWIDAFETGDVLSNTNDHAYLQSDHDHLGEHGYNPEPARKRTRSASAKDNSSSAKSTGVSSILQTLTVFFFTALLIGGGIYAYKTFEPMLQEALSEDAKDARETTPASVPTESPVSTEEIQQKPPVVVQTDPSIKQAPTPAPTTTDKPAEPEPPVFISPNRTGKPPKAMVIEEDE